MTQAKTAVIGAGACGIAAAKALADADVPFDCFEMSDRVGGNWVFKNKNGQSSAYRSLSINTSRQRLQFRDFPMPKEYPDYPRHELIAAYFESYAAHFDLHKRIQFQTSVVRAEPTPSGTWRVELSDGRAQEYRALVVANGHHWQPAWPDPKIPGQFSGIELHSHAYIDPDEPHGLRGKRVVVVGMGNSAMDIACELARPGAAERVFLSARRGAWVLPKYVFGKPLDQTAFLPAFLSAGMRQAIAAAWYRLYIGRPQDYGLLKPDHRIGSAHPTLSSDIFGLLRAGQITPKPSIAAFSERELTFADGSREEVDAIVYCTGYSVSFPFFDPATVSAPGNDLPLYFRLFDLKWPNLFFVGLCQPLGAVMPIAELQAKLLAEYLTETYALPDPAEMRARTERERRVMFARYVTSRRHTMQVDFDDYMRDLEKELQNGRKRAQKRQPAA